MQFVLGYAPFEHKSPGLIPSAASSTHNISESYDPITSSSVSLNVPSFLPPTREYVAPVDSTVNTTMPPNTSVLQKVKQVSAKASDNPRNVSMYKLEQENKNKGDLISWMKRKLSPEKDADTSLIAKQSRCDSLKK